MLIGAAAVQYVRTDSPHRTGHTHDTRLGAHVLHASEREISGRYRKHRYDDSEQRSERSEYEARKRGNHQGARNCGSAGSCGGHALQECGCAYLLQ